MKGYYFRPPQKKRGCFHRKTGCRSSAMRLILSTWLGGYYKGLRL